MTLKERVTLESMNQKFEDFVQYDSKWKSNFDDWKINFVEPLIQSANDAKAVRKAINSVSRMIVAILGAVVTIALILHYFGFLIGVKL